jgi:nitroreductase
MDLRFAIRTNGTVRDFVDAPVDDETVITVLDDAKFAPSGGNRQPWRVAVVKDSRTRLSLAALMRPTWNEYLAASKEGQVPYNTVSYQRPEIITDAPNNLLDNITSVPVVLAVAADLTQIGAMDGDLDRVGVVPGASIYPFCWNLMLAARAQGLGGVMTTFLSRTETEAASILRLPEHHALAAVIFLGYPVLLPTKLRRSPVSSFASVDTFDGPSLS